MSADLILSLLIASMSHAAELGALYTKLKTEGREATDAETQAVFDKDTLARAKLTIDIAAAKAAGK